MLAATLDNMQRTLVPPIVYEGARVEAYGYSIPKDDVGGDLVDLVADGKDVIAYVADVSGHGLRAGVLMGIVKTAFRYGLLLGQSLTKLLGDMNRILPAVKTPNMFATLAGLRFGGSNEVEYISAGHVPLLHYRRRRGDVIRYCMSQFPVGLFAGAGYASQRIPYEPGDLFALITDGVVEAGVGGGAEFGLDRLAEMLRDLAGLPLADIAAAVNAEVRGSGEQEDDQSILLVRAAQESDEAKWRKVLEELAAELERD